MHVSGVKTSLQGVVASKVIVAVGERSRNLKGTVMKHFPLAYLPHVCTFQVLVLN